MPKIIFTSRYLKSGKHGGSLVKYMATRSGVSVLQHVNGARPATKNQKRLIAEVLEAVPDVTDLFEHEDYIHSPTIENASALITTAFEQNPELWDNVRNYVEYIARRPGAERSAVSGHGLWNDSEAPLALAEVVREVTNHKGNLWTHVVSLRREDAQRMGYTDAATWRNLVLEQLPTIAEAMKIPMSDLRWYAAYHDRDSNPHIHLVVYSQDPSRGYLTKQGIETMRSAFAHGIYQDELMHIYERKDLARSELNQFADERLRELASSIDTANPDIQQKLVSLGQQLWQSKGRKQYGYLKPALKAQADDIVRLLAADPRIHEIYNHWCELSAEVRSFYSSTAKPIGSSGTLALEHEKTFRTIKNMVVQQALAAAAQALAAVEQASEQQEAHAAFADAPSDMPIRLTEPPTITNHELLGLPEPLLTATAPIPASQTPAQLPAATALLRSLARLIQQDYQQQKESYEQAVDRKLMAKIRRKKQELGQRLE